MFASVAPPATPDRKTDSQQALWTLVAESSDAAVFGPAWLALQCAMVPDAVRAVLVVGPPDTGPFLPVAFWPAGQQASVLLAEVAELSLQGRQASAQHGDTASALACPVMIGHSLHALVALETGPRSDAGMQALTRQLQWGTQGIVAALLRQQAAREEATRERLMGTLDLVASAMTETRFPAAADALANDLALQLKADRVSIGFRHDGHTRVEAMSNSAQIARRMNLVRAIGSAMDEAIDQKSVLQVPLAAQQLLVARDHAALARQHGNDAILTVPFITEGLQAGAFTFERSGERPFQAQEVALCQAVVALCSRILEEKRLNDRLLLARLKDMARDQLQKLTGPRHFGRKLAAIVSMLAVLFFSVASGDYVVGAQAGLEGVVRRVLVAPFDGYIESAPQRAGDVIKAGTVLATLDQRDLQLEYLRWASQAEQYSKQYQEALAKSDRVQVNIIQAQLGQAKAQMDLLGEQLARASIVAPFAGIVVSGDLSQSLGGAVKRGQTLFEVAPLNGYRVMLEVDESDIADVRAGQAGKLMLAALPGQEFGLRVTHVTPVSGSRDGRSFFRVEASVIEASDKLRPGMEGVGRIELGRRKLIWLWTHKLADWLRLALWSWI